MKKRILLAYILLALSFTKIFAQIPATSTKDDPVWYYIQVEGESDRADLVFTAENDKVYGRAMINSLEESKVAPQLWRFEAKNNKYTIINKATGKKIDAGYDSNKKISNMILATSASAEWEFSKTGNFFNIKSTKVPTGGSLPNVYAHQGSNWDSRNYVIMLESSSYNGTVNSKFKFVEFEKYEIEYSTDNKEIWYYMNSANPGYEDKCITDATKESLHAIVFSLSTIEKNNNYQLWKVVKKSTTTNEQYVHFINKETQNVIQAKSVANEFYKYTQATTNLSTDKGWTTKYLGRGQFEISGEEEDGVIRYLNASSTENKQPDFYEEDASSNSTFAWFFKKADDYWTSTPLTNINNDIRVFAKDRYVIVEGAEKYDIYTIQGVKVNKEKQLPFGIYMVTVEGKTTKLIIK
ncbi:RICIN domain-containing protein [Bacteroidales bacterium OttesenSCG-928-M06]|nr:RICIN domain-containing protein [Bacteroidales bacterium OttesenSCG-928-M06]